MPEKGKPVDTTNPEETVNAVLKALAHVDDVLDSADAWIQDMVHNRKSLVLKNESVEAMDQAMFAAVSGVQQVRDFWTKLMERVKPLDQVPKGNGVPATGPGRGKEQGLCIICKARQGRKWQNEFVCDECVSAIAGAEHEREALRLSGRAAKADKHAPDEHLESEYEDRQGGGYEDGRED